MIIILSPSKGQDFETPVSIKKYSTPADLKDTELLVKELRKYKSADLQSMMGISENLARLNVERYKAFKKPFTLKNSRQAVFAFKGDVYRGIDIGSFTKEDIEYAQQHLRILSGLYGCLRPLDLIQPYRLEMKTRLENPRGDNLYRFWGDGITASLNKALKTQREPLLVNLASNVYFRSVKPKLLEGDVLNINFKETKNGKTRTIATFAKQARGLMAACLIRDRVESQDGIKRFTGGGYRFSRQLSDDGQLTFTRPQP